MADMTDETDEFARRVQRKAETHLDAVVDAMDDPEAEDPSLAPFDGCTTCVVREVLGVVWEDFVEEAKRMAAEGNDAPAG